MLSIAPCAELASRQCTLVEIQYTLVEIQRKQNVSGDIGSQLSSHGKPYYRTSVL